MLMVLEWNGEHTYITSPAQYSMEENLPLNREMWRKVAEHNGPVPIRMVHVHSAPCDFSELGKTENLMMHLL